MIYVSDADVVVYVDVVVVIDIDVALMQLWLFMVSSNDCVMIYDAN